MNRRIVGAALLVTLASGLTACTGDAAESSAVPYAADSAGGGKSAGPAEDPAAVGKQDIDQPGVNRALVRTATLALTATDVAAAVDHARDIAATGGGYAGREEVRRDAATLTLHIPSDRFDKALGELSDLGSVTSRTQSAEDVTEQVVDLESRVATQRASVDRVRTLLTRANTVDEIVRIEQEVTTREADLESLEQRRQALSGQVAMSTVTISVTKSDAVAATPDESGGFLAGLSDGWHAFLDAGAATLRVLGAVLPFLLVLAVPAVPAIRWYRRRRLAAPAVQQP